MDQTQRMNRKIYWVFFCPILVSLDPLSISARLLDQEVKNIASLALCVGLATKEQYMRTLQGAILKGKYCERCKSNLTDTRYSGSSFCPPPSLISSFPILLSLPFLIPHLTHLQPPSFTLFPQDGFPGVCSPPGLLGPSDRAHPKRAPAALQRAQPRGLGLQSLEGHSWGLCSTLHSFQIKCCCWKWNF